MSTRESAVEPLRGSRFVCAEKYLVRVISPISNCETFDNLRFEMYKTKQKAVICGHLLRSYYFVCLCWNLLDSCSKILEPANYGKIIENEPLAPAKNFCTVLSDFTSKCRCKKRRTKNRGYKRSSEKCRGYCDSANCKNA